MKKKKKTDQQKKTSGQRPCLLHQLLKETVNKIRTKKEAKCSALVLWKDCDMEKNKSMKNSLLKRSRPLHD